MGNPYVHGLNKNTLPETNSKFASEHRPFNAPKGKGHLPTIDIQGGCHVSFREGKWVSSYLFVGVSLGITIDNWFFGPHLEANTNEGHKFHSPNLLNLFFKKKQDEKTTPKATHLYPGFIQSYLLRFSRCFTYFGVQMTPFTSVSVGLNV